MSKIYFLFYNNLKSIFLGGKEWASVCHKTSWIHQVFWQFAQGLHNMSLYVWHSVSQWWSSYSQEIMWPCHSYVADCWTYLRLDVNADAEKKWWINVYSLWCFSSFLTDCGLSMWMYGPGYQLQKQQVHFFFKTIAID